MSIDIKELLGRIPQDKLLEIVNGIADITPEQLIEKLGAEGVAVSTEEAPALLESLVSAVNDGKEIAAEDLMDVAGGYITWQEECAAGCSR